MNLGRIQKQTDPWSFWRIDNTTYYSNDRWDNGKYTLDGGNADFKLFGAKLSAFAGRTSERYSVNGVDLNQVVLGNNRVAGGLVDPISGSSWVGRGWLTLSGLQTSPLDVDRILGVQGAFPLFKFSQYQPVLPLDGQR